MSDTQKTTEGVREASTGAERYLVTYIRVEPGWQKAQAQAAEGSLFFDLVRNMDNEGFWGIEAASQPPGAADEAYALLAQGAIRGGFSSLAKAKRALEETLNPMTESKPRYTVELTTEGWQIKDNLTGEIGASAYGSEGGAQQEADYFNETTPTEDTND